MMASPTHTAATVGRMGSEGLLARSIHHYGCMILLCERGSAKVAVNQQPMAWTEGKMLILTSELHLIAESASIDFSARTVTLPESVFNTVYHQISSISLWEYLYQSPLLSLEPDQLAAAHEWINQLEWAIGHLPATAVPQIASNSAFALFTAIDTMLAPRYPSMRQARKDRRWTILTRFYSLLYSNYTRRRDLEFYASQMHITVDYLTKICHSVYGNTAKALVDDVVLEEIKLQLTTTGKTVAQIATDLNFADASYLTRYFRRHTGITPTSYRRQH